VLCYELSFFNAIFVMSLTEQELKSYKHNQGYG